MKALATFVVKVLLVAGLVVAAVYWFDLEPEITNKVVLITAGLVLAIVVISFVLTLVRRLRKFRKKPSGTPVDEKKARRQRLRILREKCRQILRAVRVAEGQKLFYREQYGRPWWLVTGEDEAELVHWVQEELEGKELIGVAQLNGLRVLQNRQLVFLCVTTASLASEEVLAFIKQLERRRPRAPIAGGVIVAGEARVEGSEAIIRFCRHLRIEIPVYLVLTQIDQIEGYSRIIATGLDQPLIEWSPSESSRELLLATIRSRALGMFPMLARQGESSVGIQFLRSFAECRRSLTSWLQNTGKLDARAIVYATSSQGELGQLNSLLERDSHRAKRSHSYFQTKRSQQGFVAIVAILVCCLFGWGASIEFRRCQDFLAHTFQQLGALSNPSAVELSDYRQYLEYRPTMQRWWDGGPRQTMGLSSVSPALPVVSRRFTELMCQDVIRHLVVDVERDLHRFVEGSGNQSDALQALKFYILMTRSEKSYSPDPWGGEYAEWVAEFMAARWYRAFGRDTVSTQLRELSELFLLYGEIVSKDRGNSDLPCKGEQRVTVMARDLDLVEDTQRKILRMRKTDYNFETMLAYINSLPEARPVEVVVVAYKSFDGVKEVLPAFTEFGWKQMQALLDEAVAHGNTPSWLLDESANIDERQSDCENIRGRYENAYIDVWRDVVSSIRIDSPTSSLEEVRSLYDEIVNEEPFVRVLKKVHRHTDKLPELRCPESVSKKVELDSVNPITVGLGLIRSWFGASAKESRVSAAFRQLNRFSQGAGDDGSRLGDYQSWLRGLRDGIAEAAAEDSPEYSQLDVELTKTENELSGLLGQQEWRAWKNELRGLLFPPLDVLRGIVDEKPLVSRTENWCTRVVLPTRVLTKSYPFRKVAQRQADLKEIRKIFHPLDGEVAKFRREYLPGVLSEGVENNDRLTGEARRFFRRAHALGVLLFPGADGMSNVRLTIQCNPKVAPVVLLVGEQEFRYSCASADRFSATWPEGEGAKISYGFRQDNMNRTGKIEAHGEFALFKLLEQGAIQAQGRSAITRFMLPHDLGVLPVVVHWERVEDRGNTGTLLFGFEEGQAFLAPFRQDVLRSPPTALYAGVRGRRRCE